MDRFQPIDVSNSSLGAHLYPSEEVLSLSTGVGLYSGPIKSLPHANGTVYLTSHRLFYIDDDQPHKHSCFVRLSIIHETQFFAGFLKSSPKVTIGFRPRQEEDEGGASKSLSIKSTETVRNSNDDWRLHASVVDASADALPTTSWVCRVCAFSNTFDPGLDKNASVACALCGVSTEVKDLVFKQPTSAPSTANRQSFSTSPYKAGPSITQSAPPKPSDGIPCPVCTFSNHPSMLRCEMCDSPLTTAANIAQATASYGRSTPSLALSTPPARTPSKTPEPPEDQGEQYNHVRLSFRKGGDKSFYDALKITLKEKRWQRLGEQQNDKSASTAKRRSSQLRNVNGRRFAGNQSNIDGRSATAVSDDEEGGTPSRRVGIEGILSAVDLQAREEKSDMQDALRDLEALMTRAKKMVDLAESLNAKLMRQESSSNQSSTESDGAILQRNDEAANLIRSSLVRLGLPSPAITSDMAKDQMEYNVQLARELANLLYAPKRPLIGKGKVLVSPRSDNEQVQFERSIAIHTQSSSYLDEDSGQGIMSLDEVWCIWNRARGVALVSPKDLLAILPLLCKLTSPTISCKTFGSSSLKVLHTPRFAVSNLNARICILLRNRQQESVQQDQVDSSNYSTISTLEFAQLESCPLHLMTELLNDVEYNLGEIVRDQRAGQDYWYLNRFNMA